MAPVMSTLLLLLATALSVIPSIECLHLEMRNIDEGASNPPSTHSNDTLSLLPTADENLIQSIVFSDGSCNEWVDCDALQQNWLDGVEKAMELELSRENLTDLFDADGVPTVPLTEDGIGAGSANSLDSSLKSDAGDLAESLKFAVKQILETRNVATTGTCAWDRAQNTPCTSQFREPTGRCTNMVSARKTWGMSTTPYTRVLAAQYQDGMNERRRREFLSGVPLKSARQISTLVTSELVILNNDGFNAQVMQWGQFMAHEFSQLAKESGVSADDCCPDVRFMKENPGHQPNSQQLEVEREEITQLFGSKCMPVEMERDSVYGQYVCMPQKRAKAVPTHQCLPGPRQQMNAASHVIDASAVYGSLTKTMNNLRSFSGGRMKVQSVGGHTLLPQDPEACNSQQQAINQCPFMAGDNRNTVTPNLASTHTIFVIKHNHIADELSQTNPHWNDERLFQESRRIISAMQASIHYYEYLPIVIGPAAITKYKLGSYQGFDEDVNPSVLNELAGAAFRFGHSLIDGRISTVGESGRIEKTYDLTQGFLNPSLIYIQGIKPSLKGLMLDRPWKADDKFPKAMRDSLFNRKQDIVAFNINRGRDLGFQSYLNYRRRYGLTAARNFNDLLATHTREVVDGLRSAYTSVEDIELYIGGVTEIPMQGAYVGELFANIIGDGFTRLMKGDRFFFESNQSGLTPAQIQAIKSYKYHQLICESAEIDTIVNNAFRTSRAPGAQIVSCSSLPKLDLTLWREGREAPAVVTPPVSINTLISSTHAPVTTTSGSCSWQSVDMTDCCTGFGERITTRECVGGDNCHCSGSSRIVTKCMCHGVPCTAEHLTYRCQAIWRRLGISPNDQ